MNLLEIIILRVFLVLFSIPSCPAMEKKADTPRVELARHETPHAVQTVNYTPGLKITEENEIIERPRKQKNPPYPLDCTFTPGPGSLHTGDREPEARKW